MCRIVSAAGDAFEVLTWGQGPRVLRQGRVQVWLWYWVSTKYVRDEVEYMSRPAAAALFDELGLHRYATICRSPETEAVHAASIRARSSKHKRCAII